MIVALVAETGHSDGHEAQGHEQSPVSAMAWDWNRDPPSTYSFFEA